jgi:uncharacterized protein YjbI with pentapeptide repeats
LSGYDLRNALIHERAKLTAIKASGSLFMGMKLNRVELQHAMLDDADFRSAHSESCGFPRLIDEAHALCQGRFEPRQFPAADHG